MRKAWSLNQTIFVAPKEDRYLAAFRAPENDEEGCRLRNKVNTNSEIVDMSLQPGKSELEIYCTSIYALCMFLPLNDNISSAIHYSRIKSIGMERAIKLISDINSIM